MQVIGFGIGLETGKRKRAGRFGHHAGILEDILDGAADGVRIHENDVIEAFAAELEALVSNAFDGNAVGEEAHFLHFHRTSGGDGAAHVIRVDRLDTDDLHFGAQLLDVHGDTGGKSTAANGHEDSVKGTGILAQNFHADRSLPGNDVLVIEGRNKHSASFLNQLSRLLHAVAEGFAGKDNLTAETAHSGDLDGRARLGHHDGRLTAELRSGKSHALGVVAGRGSNNAAAQFLSGKLHHLVVGAANLEGENGLGVFALEQYLVAQTPGERYGRFKGRLHSHVIDAAEQDAFKIIIGRHGKNLFKN